MKHQVGDLFTLFGTGDFEEGIECIVMEVAPDDGRILKAKAAHPDERLAKMGFIIEGDDYVIIEWNWSDN